MQKENVTILFLSINVLLFDLLLKPSTHYRCSCEETFCKKTGFFSSVSFILPTDILYFCMEVGIESFSQRK